jgi:ATP-dependent DNA ligase
MSSAAHPTPRWVSQAATTRRHLSACSLNTGDSSRRRPRDDWLKKTCGQRETLPIAGFSIKDKQFDGIYEGRQKGRSLVDAGKVYHGFDKASLKDLQARLKPLIRKTQPDAKKIPHRGIWVEP